MEWNGTHTARKDARGFTVLPLMAAAAAACALRGGDQPFPELERYEGRRIEDVEFVGTGPFAADTLEDIAETEPTRCRLLGLPICVPGTDIGREEHRLDADVLRKDVRQIELFYRASGYYGTRVEPDVRREADEGVAVTFRVRPGDAVTLDTLRVEGTAPVLDPDAVERGVPLQPGELFDYGEFVASADSVLRVLRERGYAYADVLRNFDVDTVRDRATARLLALPGPVVTVDTVVVLGADNLGRRGTLRQLTFERGDVVRLSDLRNSQRNLYALELVQIATVGISPAAAAPGDALAAPPAPDERPTPPPGLTPADTVPGVIVVTIEEAPVHVVDAVVGFGTVECLRTQVDWVSRSFGPGARRLTLTAGASKIGIGSGLGGICDSFEGDPFRTDLDYRATAEYTQPWLFTPRDRLTVGAFAERQSEPAIFQRTAAGGSMALLHELDPRQFLSATVDVQNGRTRATPALFCLAFLVCLPDDIAELQRFRWRNTLSVGWVRDRLNLPVEPDSGHAIRTSLADAAPWLGSDLDFVRWTGEAAFREPVGRANRTLAFRVRLGSFFGTATLDPDRDFLPPEERFFAGGPSSVRGFGRNELGPGVYVFDTELPDTVTEVPDTVPNPDRSIRFVPTGGTSVAVASAEYRFPALFARDRLRWALFVDAGAVADDNVFGRGTWRVTPGIGVRIRTPVGPIRLDVGYNPYGLPRGPLFAADPETGALVRVRDRFELDRSFWERLQLHLAIGEPF